MGALASDDLTGARSTSVLRILIVDDDPVDAGLLADACVAVPAYDVRCRLAADLDEARRMLAAEAFDMVFADYWLGDGTSVPLIAELARRPGCPVIMTSSADTLDIRTIGTRAGAQGFLAKPDLTRSGVHAAIHAAVRGRAPARADGLPKSARRLASADTDAGGPRSSGTGEGGSLSDRIRADAEAVASLLRRGRAR